MTQEVLDSERESRERAANRVETCGGQLLVKQVCFRSLSGNADKVTSDGNTNTTKVMDEHSEIGSPAVWGRTLKQLSQGPVATIRT